VEEFADIMPARLGGWMLRTGWATRFMNRLAGKGKVLQTTSLAGFLELYSIAGLRRWRRGTLRFKREHQRIEKWLAIVKELGAVDYDLACEVAECPRLVKGYGDTHLLGSRNFESLMQSIPALREKGEAATRLKQLREAALADDTGQKLADALRNLGIQQGGQA
jgi:indolepyruvate ferredoxin oxidoreductase, beta subunit